MRILCEGCKGQYHIDDSFMSERGIRAQCPKCSHITIITKTQQAIHDDQDQRLPSVSYCINCGRQLPSITTDPIPMCESCQELEAKTGGSGERAPVPEEAGLDLDQPPGFVGDIDYQDEDLSASFRRAELGPSDMVQEDGPSISAMQGRWRIKKFSTSRIYGPFDHQTIVDWVNSGKVTPADEISGIGGEWKPAAQHQDFGDAFRNAPRPQAPVSRSHPDTRRTPRRMPREFPWRIIVVIGIVVFLGGGGLAAWRLGYIAQIIERLSKPEVAPDSTDKRLEALKQAYPGIAGNSDEHLAAGLEQLQIDTIAAYEAAREDLEIAVVLDNSNAAALAHLAEVYALLGWYDRQESLLSDALLFAQRSVRDAPDAPEGYIAQATVLLAKRSNPQNVVDAQAALQNVLPGAKDNPSVLFLLGVAARDRPEEAEKFFGQAISRNPKLVRPKLELADLALEQRQILKASTVLKPLRRRSIVAAYRLGEIFEQLGRYKEASSAYTQAAANARAVTETNPRWRVVATMRAARIQYQVLGRGSEALRTLESVAKQEGSRLTDRELRGALLVHLAAMYRLRGRNNEATRTATQAIEEAKAFLTEARLQAALTLARQGKQEEAIRELDKVVLPSVPARERSVVRFVQGQIKAEVGRTDEARTHFEEAVRLDPYNAAAMVADAVLLVRVLKQDEDGIARMLELAKLDPVYFRSRQRITDLYVGDDGTVFQTAVQVFNDVRKERSYSASAWSALGIAQFYNGDRGGARSSFQRALIEDGDSPIAHLYMGLDLDLSGRWAKALDQYEAANRTDLQNAHLLTAMARCRGRLDQTEKAEEHFTRAINADPTYAPAYYWFGEYYSRKKNQKSAITRWSQALERDPHYTTPWQALYGAGS